MIWRRFQRGGSISYGRAVDDKVIEVNGSPVNHPAETGAAYALGEVRLLAPLIPRMLYAASPNCRGHVEGMAARRGSALSYPWSLESNFRSVPAGIGPEADIVAPADSSGAVQPEGQPAVALGKRARKVTAACGPGLCLWLYHWQRHQRAGGNDISERVWQIGDRTMFRSKNYDSFKPLGPWTVTGLEHEGFRSIVRHNGEVWEDFTAAIPARWKSAAAGGFATT